MVARLWLWICLLAAMPVFGHAQPCHEVFGYYAGWKWYDRGKLVNPATINYSNYTVIAYAFFKPLSDGTVVCPDPWAEKNLLSGLSADTRKHPTLISEAHRNRVKVVLSVGGWTYSDIFPLIASSEASRKRFAASCASLVEKYRIDGIDIDWEYPGYARHGGSEADTRNFTLLLTELRSSLDKLGARTGKKMLLSSAFGVSAARLDAIEWDQVEPLLDCINLMSYNYSGPWDEFTGHNAPLFSQGPENSSLNIDYTVHYLIREKRVTPGKINIGIAFFGRASSTDDTPALRGTTTGKPDLVNFGADNGAPEYYNIIAKLEKYHYRWDDQSGVPYLAGRSGNNSFVTFDDPRSVSLKARYAVETGLKGVIIWEITGDYLPDGKSFRTPLATAISEALCEPATEEKYYERPGAGAN